MLKMILTGLFTSILFYSASLLLYLLDILNAPVFLSVLFLGGVIQSILFIIVLICQYRMLTRLLGSSLLVLVFLTAYEFPLLFYLSAPTYVTASYFAPEEVVEGSGIYSVGVQETRYKKGTSKKYITELMKDEGIEILSITQIDNQIIYGVKNRQLLSWLHLTGEHTPKEMVETVQSYLGTEEDWVATLNRPNTGGDSAGLSLVLSGLYKKGKLDNQLPIAVSAGIDKHGNATKVNSIKEKLQIIEQAGIHVAIMSNKNRDDALKFQKELNSKVEVFFVDDVQDAQRTIEEINKN